jgi:hypothetical protein
VRQNRGQTEILDEAELHDAPGGPTLRLRFRGAFEGRPVIWLATLTALAVPSSGGSFGEPASYIEIGEEGPEGVPISVGLPVAAIDEPTIRKAMIMIRRYRRLRRGRHEYGRAGQAAPRSDP